MITPCVDLNEQLNQMSAEIERIQKEINKKASMIAFIDKEMREVAGLASEVAGCKLKVLKEYLQQAPEKRDYTKISSNLKEEFNTLSEDFVGNFKDLLKARQYYLQNGKVTELTMSKRLELEERYSKSLKTVLEEHEANFNINDGTNVQVFISHLEEEEKKKRELFNQLLDSKTPHTMEMENLQNTENKQMKQKFELLTGSVKDVYGACQIGAFGFLKTKSMNSLRSDFKILINTPNNKGFYPIHIASYHNHPEIVRLLAESGANLEQKDANGYTALHWAAKAGTLEVVKLLLDKKVNIKSKGEYGRTPLHMAVFNSRPQVASLLLKRGAEINSQTDMEDNLKTPLLDAVIHGDIELAKLLLKEAKLDVNCRDIHQHTPLYHVVVDGISELIPLILGHVKWSNPTSEKDPNHTKELLKIIPKYNDKEVKRILTAFHETVPQ